MQHKEVSNEWVHQVEVGQTYDILFRHNEVSKKEKKTIILSE